MVGKMRTPNMTTAVAAIAGRYCSRKSSKKDFLLPAGATGLPYASKPFFCAASEVTGPPATVVPAGPPIAADGPLGGGAVEAAGDASTDGPGGSSSGPARPQALRPKAATLNKTSANPMLGRSERTACSPRQPHHITVHGWGGILAATCCGYVYFALSRASQRLACARTFFGAVPP